MKGGFDPDEFAKRLWGDVWYDSDARKFKKRNPGGGLQRTFVQYVLEPIYKVYAHVVGEQKENLKETLADIGVRPTLSSCTSATCMCVYGCPLHRFGMYVCYPKLLTL